MSQQNRDWQYHNETTLTGSLVPSVDIVILKNTSGHLHTVTINKKGASSNTLQLFDGITDEATSIGIIDTTANVGTLFFDCQLLNGLCYQLLTGTAADVTITFE